MTESTKQITCKLFLLSIVMAVVLILVYNGYQQYGMSVVPTPYLPIMTGE